jgi:hypothetical protein
MMKKTVSILLFSLVMAMHVTAYAASPVAVSFSTAVPVSAQSVIQLQGSDADATPLTFATTTSPAHGALSNLNTSTGTIIYTPTAGYTGTDSFQYTVTSGGDTSSAATVTLTITAAKTRIIDSLTNPDGTARTGRVSFFLTQVASSPSGIIPAKASVSAQLNSSGGFYVSVYPSRAVSPAQYYQVWFDDTQKGNTQLLGIYDIPASVTTISLTGHRVTDANLGAQFTFMSRAEAEAMTAAVAAATTAQLYPLLTTGKHVLWTGTGFANSITSESNSTVTVAGNQNVTGALTAGSYVGIKTSDIPSLGTVQITSGVFDQARIPTTLNGITCVNCTNVGVGTGGGLVNVGDTVIGSTGGRVGIQTNSLERIGIDSDGAVTIPGLRADPTLFPQLSANPATWAQARNPANPLTTFTGGETGEMYNPSAVRLTNGDQLLFVKGAIRIHLWKSTNDGATYSYQGVALTGTGSTWDASGVVEPFVIFDQAANLLRMYYKGFTGSVYQAGYATASPSTPLVWTKQSTPVLTASAVSTALAGGATLSDLAITSVIKSGSTYYFYGYYGVSGGLQLFEATGTTWTNPTPSANIFSTGVNSNPASPDVFKSPGSPFYTMLFSEGGPQATAGISPIRVSKVATSRDGLNWERIDRGGVLIRPTSATSSGTLWERDETFTPKILKKGTGNFDEPFAVNGRYQLYYSGDTGAEARSGMMYLDPAAARQPPLWMSARASSTGGITFENSVGQMASAHITSSDGVDGVELWIATNLRLDDAGTLTTDDAGKAGVAIALARTGELVFERQFGGTISQSGFINTDGTLFWNADVKVTDSSKGLIIKAPGGTYYRVTVSDLGALVLTAQ